MKKVLAFAWLFFALVSQSCAQSMVFTADQLRQDFRIFRQSLIDAHPGLYRFSSKKEMDERFAAAEKKLTKGMTEEDFFDLLNPIVAAIKCGHTKFFRDGKPDDAYAFHQEGLFPLKLYFRNGKAYALKAYTGTMPSQPGAEVVSINGRSVGEILSKLFANIFADGNVVSAKYEELNHFFPGYYANVIGANPDFTIEYLDHSGKKLKATLKSVKLADIQSSDNADPNTSNSFNITYPAANVALIRIPVFMEPDGQPYEDFLKNSFEAIREKKISNLILDLRDNGGGMDKMGKQLYAYLTSKPFNYYDHLSVAIKDSFTFPQYATLPGEFEQLKQFIEKTKDGYVFTMHENLGVQQPQEQPYLGKLFVLQNGSSFSVTAEFASIVRDNKRGVFIGDESGGALSGNNSGGFAFVKLPNTHLNLAIPLLGYYISLQHKQNGDRGILPDHSVIPTAKDVLQKKDVVLEYTLQLIGNK